MTGGTMQGRRVRTFKELRSTPGAYMQVRDMQAPDDDPGSLSWWATTPNGLGANLGNHEVVEHEDGTITVSPSILVDDGAGKTYHGHLVRGEWTP